jgi:hypothetical protein
MSLHGFIADTNDQVGPMFDWYRNGDVDFTGSDPNMVFHVSPASAEYLRTAWSNVAVDVIGRRLFDLTNGWNGRPAVGEAVFVVTHEPPVRIDLVPVVFGSGVSCRLCSVPVCDISATMTSRRCCSKIPRVVQGDRVTHLHYRKRK